MKKSVITLLIFLIMIISVSAVSAADDASDLGASDDTIVSVANTDTAVVADSDVKNFTYLNADIAVPGDIDLDSNYIRNTTGETGTTVSIDNTKIIDGHGYTIDSNGTGSIFSIGGTGTVTLKNVILKNTGSNAIVNNGVLTLENVTFINCSANAIDSQADSTLTVTDCTFEDYGIAFAGSDLSLSGNTFNNASKAFVEITKGNLLTTSTIYTAGVIGATWNTINYTATVKDDKGNLITIAKGWKVTVGGGDEKTTATGTASATNFGTQEIVATNDYLTNPAKSYGNVTVTPDAKASEIGYSFSNDSAIVYGDNFNITVEITNVYTIGTNKYYPDGTFTIIVNNVEGETVAVNTTTGKATFEFTNIAVNTYVIDIRYNGDDVYQTATVTVPTFRVEAKELDPVINVTIAEDGTQTVDIIFPTDATGTVTGNVTKDSAVKYNITTAALAGGKYSFNPSLPADDYVLNIDFVSTNPNYVSKTYAKSFTISKLNTTVVISVENTTYGNNVSFTITLADGVKNATVEVKKGVTEAIYSKTVNLTDGSATINLTNPAGGKYTITVTSADNDKYNENTTSTVFEVAPIETTMTMVIGEAILFKDVEANVTVKFGDKNGTGTVKLVVNGKDVVPTSFVNGTAKFTIPANLINVGENTIVAVFTSDNGNYSDKNITETITVNQVTPTIEVTVDGDVNITKDAELTIAVVGGTPAPTGFVTVKLGDKTYPTQTLANGVATLTIPAADINEVKEYSVEVTYDPNGNVNYTANSTVFKFNVTYWNMVITVGDIENKTVGNNITFTVKAEGEKIFLQNFTVAIKDAKGQIVNTTSIYLEKDVETTVQFNLTKGEYTAVISYPGDDSYDTNSTTTKAFKVTGIIENLTIEVDEVTYPGNATAIVKASVDGKYNVTFGNKNYNVTVSNGVGSVDLGILAAKDGYEINVTSLDSAYDKQTNTTTFNVKKGKVQGATLTIDAVTYPDNATAFVSADVDGIYIITSDSGLTPAYYEVEVVNGTGNVTFDRIDVGKYTFSLWTVANENYTSIKADTKQLVVNKGTVDVNLTADDVLYPNKINITVNASVAGTYTISILNANGTLNQSLGDKTLAAGVAESYDADELLPGTYTVVVTANIDNYNTVNVNKTVEVKKGIVLYNVTIADYTYATDFNATITFATNVQGTVGKGYIIYLGNTILRNVTGAATNNTAITPVLATGTYTVTVVPIADDPAFKYYNLGSDSNTTTFTVKPADVAFTVEVPGSVEYPNNVTVKIKGSTITSVFTVTVGEIVKEVNVTAGQDAEVNITDLPVGGYIAYVANTNTNYTITTKTATFSVNYGPITPTVAPVNSVYNSPALVTIVSNADGEYNVTVNNKVYPVSVVNGTGSVNVTEVLAVGSYNIKLTANIEGYVPYSNDTVSKLTVDKADVGLSVEVTNVTYPEKAVATVTADASGVYSVIVYNGTNYANEVAKYNVTITTETGVNASASVTFDVLRPVYGPYSVKVDAITYDDANLNVTAISKEIVVKQATPVIIITVNDTYSIYDEIVVDVTIANADAPETATITCDLLGGPKTKTIVNGSVNFTIPKANVVVFGTHVVKVNLTGTGDFVAASNQTAFEVTKITPKFNFTDNNATFKQDAIVNVTLIGLTDGVAPTGTITIIGLSPVTVTGDKNYTFNLGKLAAGTYTLNVTYTGDGNYTGISELYPVTIKQVTPVLNITAVTGATYPNNATLTFTTDTDGDFTIDVIGADGTVVKSIPVVNVTAGTKTVNIDGLAAGKYTANVKYVATENYTEANKTSEAFVIAQSVITIEANASNVVYPNVATVVITSEKEGKYTIVVTKGADTVYTTNGTLIAGETPVELIKLDAGDYAFTVTYESDDYTADPVTGTFTVAKGTATITITPAETTFPETAIVNITSDATGAYTVVIGTYTTSGTFAGDVVSIPVAGLGAGTYDVTVNYAGNDNYNATTATGSLVIAKAAPVIYMEVDTTAILENATLTITIPYATGSVKVNGKEIELVNGVAKYNIGALKAETYELTAIYEGNDNLTSGNNYTSFTVAKLPANLVVTVENAAYGVVPTSTITIANKDDAIVKVSIDGAAEELVTVTNGTLSGFVPVLAAGDHKVTVAYEGSDVYEAETATAYFSVGKADITVDVTATGATYPNPVTVTVTASVAGEYNLTIGTTTQVITLEAGVAKNFTAAVAAGTSDVTVSRAATTDYNAVSKTTNVTVAKGDVTLTITASDVVYPNPVTVTVTSDVAGEYTVALGTTTPQTITLEAGVAKEVQFAGLAAGTYTFTAAYAETANYNAASASANATVGKAAITVTIAADNVTYPADVVVTVTADVAGEYNLTIGTTTEVITLEAGVAKAITKSGLAAGTYDITVARAESENYSAVTQTASVTVNKVEDTPITVEATSPSAGENATVTVTLPADATGTVDVKYGDKTYSAPVVNGTATVSVPTNAAGTSTATVTYSGDDNYASASKDINITTKGNGKIIADNIRRGVNSSYDYLATLVDDAGNPISGVEITFTIDGKVYKATTNASGIATVSAGLTVSNYAETVYNVVVTNPFTGENSTATTTIVPRLIVLSGDLTAGYLENPPFVVQAFGDDGNPVGAGEIVKFTLNGKTYDIATNESGIAVRTIGLAPGQYGIYAVYEGYKTEQVVLKVQKTISVASGTIKKTAKSYTFKATLKSTKGASVSGKTITFKFNGKKYTAKTNSKGVAQYTIKSSVIKKLKTGTYKVAAVYVSEVAKANIKVK